MKEYCQAIIEQFDDNDICKKCNRPYGEHYGLECPKEGTVIIKRDLIKEALSANNEKWIKEIESYRFAAPQYIPQRGTEPIIICLSEDDLKYILSQMKEGK